MGQQEVFDYLKKNSRKWLNSRDISKGVRASIASVTSCLKKLRKSRTIDFREAERKNKFEYRFKSEKKKKKDFKVIERIK